MEDCLYISPRLKDETMLTEQLSSEFDNLVLELIAHPDNHQAEQRLTEIVTKPDCRVNLTLTSQLSAREKSKTVYLTHWMTVQNDETTDRFIVLDGYNHVLVIE